MNNITRNILTFSCIFLMALSCKNSKTEEKNKQTNVQNPSVKTINNTKEDELSEIGFELMKNESFGELKLELGTKKIKDLIGEPEEKTKSEIWEVDGEYHQDWKYRTKGIELNFKGKSDSTRTVEMITIIKPCELKTKKLIGIGSEYDKVQSAYLNNIDQSASNAETIVVGTVYGGLVFNFENNKVTSIFIGASAE